MTDSTLVKNDNYIATPGEYPLPTSGSFKFGFLGEHLVIGFLGGIFLQGEKS
jgi:hypothetical protein